MKRDPAAAWTIRRWAILIAGVKAGLLIAVLIGGGIAVRNLSTARTRLFDEIGPQRLAAFALSTALLNQETGLRGYELARRPEFLSPYTDGVRAQNDAVSDLRLHGATPGTDLGNDLDVLVTASDAWRQVVEPSARPGAAPLTPPQRELGRTRFDTVRGALDTLQNHLAAKRDIARADFDNAGTFLNAMLAATVALVLVWFVLLTVGLRRTVSEPLRRLAAAVREVADNDIHQPVVGTGPCELVQLAADIEAMRQRILDEISQLERAHAMLDVRTRELERSNSDLEQFAYVASHDLQEPLRKVASFCQLLQRRYQGLLDERGEQYIEYAVDGAKRMQNLINDLLAFSQVGRHAGEHVAVSAGKLLDDALANLEVALSLSGGRVVRGELPEVRVEASLMTVVFQNLVGNALKFRGDEPPEVRVGAERAGDDWVFSIADDGIGIDAEYADRIFVLFQRLHSRSAYPGTGIGLAMCRRIVEYHGGRIWLDTSDTGATGTTFRFTLPVLPSQEAKAEENEDV